MKLETNGTGKGRPGWRAMLVAVGPRGHVIITAPNQIKKSSIRISQKSDKKCKDGQLSFNNTKKKI